MNKKRATKNQCRNNKNNNNIININSERSRKDDGKDNDEETRDGKRASASWKTYVKIK